MYITLANRDVETARLHRIGGKLRFNDDLIPLGAEGCLVHIDSGRCSFVVASPVRLVPLKVEDVNDQTFGYLQDLSSNSTADRMLGMFKKYEEVPGNSLSYRVGDRLCRTGQPYISTQPDRHHTGQVVIISRIDQGEVWFDETGPRAARVPARYLTTAFFTAA